MNQQRIIDLVEEKISGEWGTESLNGSGVKVLRTTNFTNEGRLRFDSVVEREIDLKIVEKKKLKFGDTIIEKSGGSPNQPVGRVVLFAVNSDEPFLCNNFTAILRPKKNVHPQYFFWSLYSKHLNDVTLRYQNKTTGILNLKLERYLAEEKINVPDLKIQQKIAGILEQADAARQKRKQANQLTEQFLQSAFLEMFGDPMRNEKGWDLKKIAEMGIVKTGNTPPRVKKEFYGDFIEWIKTDNIKPEFMIPRTATEYLSENGLRVGRSVEKNSILVTCIAGSPATIGNTVLTDRKVAFNQQINSLTPNSNYNPVFVFGLFKQCKRLIQNSTTKGMKRIITKSVFENIKLINPPLPLQKKFATLVEQVEQLRIKQRESEKGLENLFGSLMQRYFG